MSDQLKRLTAAVAELPEVSVMLAHDAAGDYSVAITFGREAPDSPMAGGVALGYGGTLAEALEQALTELGR